MSKVFLIEMGNLNDKKINFAEKKRIDLMPNNFEIQNISVAEICQKYGTPLYVYDGNKILEQVNKLKNAFKGVNLKIKYACKANTNISILKLMNHFGIDLDVVSPQEIELALKSGFTADKITFTSSGVSIDEIEFAVNQNIIVNIDNLPILEEFGKKYGAEKPVMLRIRPNVVGGGNQKIMTGHKDSKFGIAIEQKDEILELVKKYNLNIVGLHQHTGSDIKDGNTFVEASRVIFELAMEFPNLKYIDLGGGFKVAYKEGDAVTDMHDLGEKLSLAFNNFCLKYGKDLELWFEPGKFLVSECGYLFANVNIVKNNPSNTLLGLNTGLNHLIRPMMYDAYHEVFTIKNNENNETETYNIVGYICETDDFAKDRLLPKTNANDIVGFKNAGAYGFSMASNYNSRFKPAEVLIFEEKEYLVRKRETMEDILKNQILVDF